MSKEDQDYVPECYLRYVFGKHQIWRRFVCSAWSSDDWIAFFDRIMSAWQCGIRRKVGWLKDIEFGQSICFVAAIRAFSKIKLIF